MRLVTRAHEWLADHVSWVQYPNVRAENGRSFGWKYEMPWYQRMWLVVMGLGLIGFSAVALFFLGVLFWAIFTA